MKRIDPVKDMRSWKEQARRMPREMRPQRQQRPIFFHAPEVKPITPPKIDLTSEQMTWMKNRIIDLVKHSDHGYHSTAAIRNALGCDPAALSDVLGAMSEAGLVVVEADPSVCGGMRVSLAPEPLPEGAGNFLLAMEEL